MTKQASKKGNGESAMGSKSKTELMKTNRTIIEKSRQKSCRQISKAKIKKKENAQDIISNSMFGRVNEIKVSYHERVLPSDNDKIKSSVDAAELVYEHWDKEIIGLHESFKVILLNNNNKVKGIYQLSQGGITGTTVDIRILFSVILKTLSVAIILVHNHPSGTLKPSGADKTLTEKIVKASQLLDIKVLDHLIIIPNGEYFSFADHGII